MHAFMPFLTVIRHLQFILGSRLCNIIARLRQASAHAAARHLTKHVELSL